MAQGGFTKVWTTVYRDSEWNEFIVRLYYRDSGLYAPADYHTTDKADAIATADEMAAWRNL